MACIILITGGNRGIEAVRWLFMGTAAATLLVNPVFYVALRKFSGRALVSHAPHENGQ